ncbi:BTAD domain-containing putative transcriptional regulator [Desulfotruncus alcoholivorax]|uniref:BTAD domain-containing putative transcriptional regulator n=1 Tax=Desulfotruncus alcoholivorax TaxID=265477 RepID=UPI00040FB8FC|nr:BTAD domain-containing putative transcriptional regulator [Desulfotruncus alcoholivorax]
MLNIFPKSKFRPPELPFRYLPRERLLALLDGGPERRLTCVVAGAGYGKSTVAAGFVRRVRKPFAWLNLDGGDGDGMAFLQLLLYGLALRLPFFKEALAQEKIMRQVHWQARGRLIGKAADMLEDSLEGQGLLVILEDYHTVAGSEEVKEVLDSLLQHFPPQICFILLSRNRFRLRALPGLAAAGRAIELGREELGFTLAEAEQIFAGETSSSLTRNSVAQIWELLSGWPMGLQLARQALAGSAGPTGVSSWFRQEKGLPYLFEDIMEEILAGEPPEIREVLLKTAVFPEWDGELFDNVFDRKDGTTLVAYLSNRGLPVERLAGKLRYHKLFYDYLLNRLKEDVDSYRDAQQRAAGFYLSRGKLVEAFPHLVAAGDFGRAGPVLQQMAPLLLRQGRLAIVGAWLNALPGQKADVFPEILLDYGEACVRAGKYREGLDWLRRAAGAFGRMGDATGLTRALCAQGSAFSARGEQQDAKVVYRQALGEVDSADPSLRGVVLHYLAVWTARMGDVEQARRFFDKATDQYRLAGETAAEAEVYLDRALFYCCRRSCFVEAGQLVDRAAKVAEVSGNVPLKARSLLIGGEILLSLCDPGGAIKKFQLAQKFFQGKETASITAVLSILGEARAYCLQDSANYRKAELLHGQAADALALVEPNLEAELVLSLGRSTVFRLRGETGPALEEALHALEMARGINDRWLEAVARLNLSSAIIAAGGENLDTGLKLLAEATSVFSAWGDEYHLALADFWRLFGLFHRTGEAEPALLQKCNQHVSKFSFLAKQERELSQFVLKQACAAVPKAFGRVEDTRSATGCCGPAPTGDIPAANIPRLRIYCLGAFQIYRGGERLDDRHWPRRKSKIILKFLALRLGQTVPKDVIMDILWPDLTAEKAANAFYVTLYALRKMLNDGLSREIEYVAVRDGMIYLDARLVEEVDVAAFNQSYNLAFNRLETEPEEAVIHLREACRLYRGDLLAEDAYAVWPVPAREKLRQQFLKVLVTLAQYAERNDRRAEALELWQEVVEREPLHETAQGEVIRLLLMQGQRDAARSQYLKYRRLLKKEVGTEPGEQIVRLYRQSK